MRKSRVDETMARVHNQNVASAKEDGLTLEEWHEKMSAIGNSRNELSEPPQTTSTIIYNSADYVLSYLFPPNRKKKKK